MVMQRNTRPDVAGAVLRYLHINPNAADTVDGILDWWLPGPHHAAERKLIEQVLEALVAEGELAKTIVAGGRVVYSRHGEQRLRQPVEPELSPSSGKVSSAAWIHKEGEVS